MEKIDLESCPIAFTYVAKASVVCVFGQEADILYKSRKLPEVYVWEGRLFVDGDGDKALSAFLGKLRVGSSADCNTESRGGKGSSYSGLGVGDEGRAG